MNKVSKVSKVRCRLWLDRVGIKVSTEIAKKLFICAGHFSNDSYRNKSKSNNLHNFAIPTVNVPSQGGTHCINIA